MFGPSPGPSRRSAGRAVGRLDGSHGLWKYPSSGRKTVARSARSERRHFARITIVEGVGAVKRPGDNNIISTMGSF